MADPQLPASQNKHYSDPSWTLGLSYQATDNLLVYLQGRRSWRAGGFNGTAPAAINPGGGAPVLQNTNLFKPEHTRSEEHTSELQSLMRISYAVFCLKKHINNTCDTIHNTYLIQT